MQELVFCVVFFLAPRIVCVRNYKRGVVRSRVDGMIRIIPTGLHLIGPRWSYLGSAHVLTDLGFFVRLLRFQKLENTANGDEIVAFNSNNEPIQIYSQQ